LLGVTIVLVCNETRLEPACESAAQRVFGPRAATETSRAQEVCAGRGLSTDGTVDARGVLRVEACQSGGTIFVSPLRLAGAAHASRIEIIDYGPSALGLHGAAAAWSGAFALSGRSASAAFQPTPALVVDGEPQYVVDVWRRPSVVIPLEP
jgi:hypothetical protein